MELLAPAGSYAAFIAAVENGADAVYLGGQLFNARHSASNFTLDEIARAVNYAHLRKVKIFVTINTLILDEEFPKLCDYIVQLMDCYVDALIIQDLGLLVVCKTLFPKLPLHASTQMTVHNHYGTKWLENEGIERVVLARELSLEEIKFIARNTNVELETFVHGALCFSYSGQCLFSSMIGARSGNRGRCAQPCRMTYQLVDEKGSNLIKEDLGEHLLSPRDLNVSESLPKLDEAGINSFKIEGRMKRPEYVATVVRIYRSALNKILDDDKFAISNQEKKDLTQIFNREFTTGYYFFNPGRSLMSYKRPNNRGTFLGRVTFNDYKNGQLTIKLEDTLNVGDGIEIWVTKGGREGFTVSHVKIGSESVMVADRGDNVLLAYQGNAYPGDRVFKTADNRLQEAARGTYTGLSARRVALDINLQVATASPMRLTLIDEDGNTVIAQGVIPAQEAITSPLTVEGVKKHIDRFGNTAFLIKSFSAEIAENVMLPVSEINAVRRRAVAELESVRLEKFKPYQLNKKISPVSFDTIKSSLLANKDKNTRPLLSIAVGDLAGFKAALEAKPDIIYIGGEQFRGKRIVTKEDLNKSVKMAEESLCKIVFALPKIWHDHEAKYLTERINIAKDAGINAFQVSSPAGITLLRESAIDKDIYLDHSFNIFNSYALKHFVDNGIVLAGLSPELTLKQVGSIKGLQNYAECLIFGILPVMVSEHCIIGSTLGGRDESTKCSMPCKNGEYALQDRLNITFPVLPDMACRSHIFNSKVLNLMPNLTEIYGLSPASLRIDLRMEKPHNIKIVTKIFANALSAIYSGVYPDFERYHNELLKIYPQGFTKGHYFRGVTNVEDRS